MADVVDNHTHPFLFLVCFPFIHQSPVVRKEVSANPGLNFNQGFIFFQ